MPNRETYRFDCLSFRILLAIAISGSLSIGLIIFKDYGISLDEPFNRMNGLVSLKYVVEKFSGNNIIYWFPSQFR